MKNKLTDEKIIVYPNDEKDKTSYLVAATQQVQIIRNQLYKYNIAHRLKDDAIGGNELVVIEISNTHKSIAEIQALIDEL